MFDINDFDETLPGPWEWDVKRLAVSMLIAARDNGYSVAEQDRIVLGTVAGYRNSIRDFAGKSNLAVWYARMEVEPLIEQYRSQYKPRMVKRTEKALAKARTRDSMSAFAKLTQRVNGTRGDSRPIAPDRAPPRAGCWAAGGRVTRLVAWVAGPLPGVA